MKTGKHGLWCRRMKNLAALGHREEKGHGPRSVIQSSEVQGCTGKKKSSRQEDLHS